MCVQQTGQIELADCYQTVWPYGVRAIPYGLLSGKYVEIELELIALLAESHLNGIDLNGIDLIHQWLLGQMKDKIQLNALLCSKWTTLLPSFVGWNRNKYLKRNEMVDIEEH